MVLGSWLDLWVSRPRSDRPTRRRTTLRVERLEERTLLAAAPLDDHPNSVVQATPLGLATDHPAIVLGTLEVSNDRDVFRLLAPRDGLLRARQRAVAGTDLDCELFLLDASGRELISNDDFDRPGTDSEIKIAVESGRTYYLVAQSFKHRTAGAYLLDAAFEDFPAHDPGDSVAEASPFNLPLTQSAVVQGAIEFTGDEDFFRLEVPAKGGLRIDYAPPPGNDPADEVFLLDASHGQVASLDQNQKRVERPVLPGQVYFVRVRGAYSLSPTYSVTVTLLLDDDFGDSPAEAEGLPLAVSAGTRINGRINYFADEDFFRFLAPENGTVRIDYAALPGAAADVVLEVLDSALNQVAYQDGLHAGHRYRTQVEFRVTAGQTYFIRADAFGATTGGYDLGVEYLLRTRAVRPPASRPVALLVPADSSPLASTLPLVPSDAKPGIGTLPDRTLRVAQPPARTVLDSGSSQASESNEHRALGPVDAAGGDGDSPAPIDQAAAGAAPVTTEQILANRDDSSIGSDLARALLTGGRAVTHLLPQRGTNLAPAAAVVPGVGGPASMPQHSGDSRWFDFVIGLDDSIHRRGPASLEHAGDPVATVSPEPLAGRDAVRLGQAQAASEPSLALGLMLLASGAGRIWSQRSRRAGRVNFPRGLAEASAHPIPGG